MRFIQFTIAIMMVIGLAGCGNNSRRIENFVATIPIGMDRSLFESKLKASNLGEYIAMGSGPLNDYRIGYTIGKGSGIYTTWDAKRRLKTIRAVSD